MTGHSLRRCVGVSLTAGSLLLLVLIPSFAAPQSEKPASGQFSEKSLGFLCYFDTKASILEVSVHVDRAQDLLGYYLDLTFDPEILQPLDPVWEKTNTLTESWTKPVQNVAEERIRIGAFGLGPPPADEGVLVRLLFSVRDPDSLQRPGVLQVEPTTTLNDKLLAPEKLPLRSLDIPGVTSASSVH